MTAAPEPPGMFEMRMPGPTVISVRIQWLPGPQGRGAIRALDEALWETALWCHRCHGLGYDHGDIDAVLEARRLGVDHAPRVVACDACGAPTCDACCEDTGTMCKACYEAGPQ
jgi:hypothetical protein